jgi:hypothetical protein
VSGDRREMTRVRSKRKGGTRAGRRSARQPGPAFTIFISHIHEEAAVARKLRDWFHAAFPGLVRAFVSSDYEDNPLGSPWHRKINRAMSRSRLLVALLSPRSFGRMWIHLETGWAIGRGIDVLPLCHNGQGIDQLPRPYSDFSGTEVGRSDFAECLLMALKQHLRLAHPLPEGMLEGLTADIRKVCGRLSSEYTTTAAEEPSRDLAGVLQARTWRLFYNPKAGPGRSKIMRFGANGTIVLGANQNEAAWRTHDGRLELLDSGGGVHSRFNYDASNRRFSHTNDPDTGSITKHGIRDQFLIAE